MTPCIPSVRFGSLLYCQQFPVSHIMFYRIERKKSFLPSYAPIRLSQKSPISVTAFIPTKHRVLRKDFWIRDTRKMRNPNMLQRSLHIPPDSIPVVVHLIPCARCTMRRLSTLFDIGRIVAMSFDCMIEVRVDHTFWP